METEMEAKFPNIDSDTLRLKLVQLGAEREYPETLMRRKNFDYPDGRLDKERRGWIRVRDEGNKVTLSYKQLNDRTLHGTKEVSVDVSDFDKTCDFLISIGLEMKNYQETKREKWNYKNVEVTIDTWPWVPSFVELEGPSEEMLKGVASDLGFDWTTAMHGSVETIYQMQYDFSEAEIDGWETITFIPEPGWLLARKKQ
jgi:adenylate cyclase class 2